MATDYLALAESAARRGERLALAMLDGHDVSDALALASREVEVYRQAHAVREFRAGRQLWVTPTRAPWAGF